MRILITGNMGYVGPAVVRHLRHAHPRAWIAGFDRGFFADCLTSTGERPESMLDEQRFGDVRDLTAKDLDGIDAIVHLAAISNDPMGKRFESVTDEINCRASINLATEAAKVGVTRFVFASSCSVYGAAADGLARKETDPLNPLTAYARSKIATEKALKQMNRRGMTVTCLRFATACGMSDRLRLDLVLNDFVACALSSGEISVLSDGTPWRPLIDVRDMARAIDWALTRDAETGGDFLAINVGAESWTFQIHELAEAVARAIPPTKVSINFAAAPDKRSYCVDFTLFKQYAPNHQPRVTLQESIGLLRDGLAAIHFKDKDFRQSRLIRLRVLEQLVATGQLSGDLRWTNAA
jgi:Nucleoside-diphosphate-sugar epimerases